MALTRRTLLGAAAAAASLTACSPSGSTPNAGPASTAASAGASTTASSSGAPVKLKLWSWRQEDVNAYQEIFKVYQQTHPNVTFDVVGYKGTEYDTILKTGLSGSDGPDLALLRSYGLMQPLARSGLVVDVTDKVAALKDFPEAVLDGARETNGGKIFGVPFAIQTLHVIYNKALFSDAGVEVPKTWDEFMQMCESLQTKDVTPFANTVTDTWMLPIEHEIFGSSYYGGEAFKKELLAGTKKWTDPAWVGSLEPWKSTSKYWGKNWQGTSATDAQTLFSSGAAAMYPGGIWEIANFLKADSSLDLGLFSVPPPPGSKVDHALTPGYVDGAVGISAKSKNQEAALEVLTWMASKEYGQLFSDRLLQLSAVPGVEPSNALLQQASADYTANPSSYLSYAYFSGGTPDAWTLESQGLSDYVLGKKSGQQVADSIQKGVGQWFKPA